MLFCATNVLQRYVMDLYQISMLGHKRKTQQHNPLTTSVLFSTILMHCKIYHSCSWKTVCLCWYDKSQSSNLKWLLVPVSFFCICIILFTDHNQWTAELCSGTMNVTLKFSHLTCCGSELSTIMICIHIKMMMHRRLIYSRIFSFMKALL